MGRVSVGVDFGSLGLRAAYTVDSGPPVPLPSNSMGAQPWILCRPTGSGPLPAVAFPSLKSVLGTPMAAPETPVVEALGVLRRSVEERTSARVARVVLSVPARYSSAQRQAVLRLARQAGFEQARLISDSVAAVVGYAERVGAGGTFAVYSLGYSGLELGLVRSAGGAYRVLGYEGLAGLGGLVLDRLILSSWFEQQGESLRSRARHWDVATWQALRSRAQAVKERLSLHDASFPVDREIALGVPPRALTFSHTAFEARTARMFEASLGRFDALLEQAPMTMAEVDTLLLVGGSTQIPSLQAVLRSRRHGSRVSWAGDLARGAAVYAARLGDAASSPRAAVIDAEPAEEPGSVEELFSAPLPFRAASPVIQAQDVLEPVRALIDDGHEDRAAALLQQVIAEAQQLLERVSPADDGPRRSQDATAAHLLGRAERLQRGGRHDEAVRTSHLAWHAALEDPDVFERMIEVHCRAAMAKPTVEQYPDAQRWLLCAHHHDKSNARVHELLAERAYLQARDLYRLGRPHEAVHALNECLAWNPEHQGGTRLQRTLGRPGGVAR
jgi:hypothetical protein